MTASPSATESKSSRNTARVFVILAVAAFFAVAVFFHLFSVNSHFYYTWKWQWIPSQTVYLILLPLAIPFFLGQAIYLRRPRRVHVALAAIMLSMFCLMIAAAVIQKDPPSFTRISDVVRSRWTTGYFAEAINLSHKNLTVHQILARYPQLLPNFFMHPRLKPPGPVLFELAMVRLFGPGVTGAMVSGFIIAFFSIFSVLAAYALIAYLTQNRDAAFFGASYFALCPAPLLFFPQFDQCYPILTSSLILLWAAALQRNNSRCAIGLGLAYALTAFITHLPGVLIFFLIGFTLLKFKTDPNCRLPRITKHFALSFGTFLAANLIFWLITGFNPVATLRACFVQVHQIWDILTNIYHLPRHTIPGTIPADLYDFALGSGWISYVLVFCYFKSSATDPAPQRQIAWLCIAQLIFIAVTGLLQTESSRGWLFMLPLLMLPIGLELAKWRPWQRFAIYIALLFLTAAICQSMEFIGATM